MYIRFLLSRIKIFFKKIFSKMSSTSYWSIHRVNTENFGSVKQSLNHFDWRNSQYPGYIDLMPVTGQSNKVVMDYGCGPGNDLVGFSEFSNPIELIGVDVSKPSLQIAENRLKLHGKDVKFIQVEENTNKIPLDNNSVDLIHSSGVLHHCKNLDKILMEFHRILKPGGEINIMVYNYYSIWVHLYTAYINQIELGTYRNLSLLDAFSKLTDGAHVPISKCYKPIEFISILNKYNFTGKLNGVAISLSELIWIKKINNALQNKLLYKEQRDFLLSLTFNEKGYPVYKSNIAGINACYNFKKID
jgi:ubiquinone/menaquinone biosynthesis C-methylase UbiE